MEFDLSIVLQAIELCLLSQSCHKDSIQAAEIHSVLFVMLLATPAIPQLLLQRTVAFLHDPYHIFQPCNDSFNALGLLKSQQVPKKINCALLGQICGPSSPVFCL